MLYELVKSNGKKPHYHLIYATPQRVGGLGFISSATSEGHSHPVRIDFNTGTFIVEAALAPKEKKPHTHMIEVLSPDSRKAKERNNDDSEEDMVAEVREKFDEAMKLEKDSRVKAKESEEFYAGKQWKPEDIAILDAEKRSHITCNEIAPKVDLLSGYFRQNRTDIKFFPTEEGDNRVAQVLTLVVDNILSQNNIATVENAIFKDSIVVGRGNYHCYIDYSRNVQGDIKVEHLGWKDAYYGPHEKLDASDCEWVIKSKWFAKDRLKKMFPEKEEELDNMYTDFKLQGSSVKINYVGHEYTEQNDNIKLNINDIDVRKKSIRVYELFKKDYDNTYGVIEVEDQYIAEYDHLSKYDIKQLEEIGLEVSKNTKAFMKIIKVAGNIFLESDYDDIDMFSTIPSYAKKNDEGFYGKVQELKEPQMEVNKRHSQSIDVVNKVAAYGYFYDNDTFADTREEQEFRDNSSKAAFVAKVKNNNKIPVQVTGVRMPTELVGMMDIASSKIEKIANISPESMGFNSREVSSVSLMETRKNTMMAQEYLFDNMNQAKRQLCKLILKYIQKIYTVERVMRVISTDNVITQEQMDINTLDRQAAYQLLNTTDLGMYDVEVSVSPDAPSVRSATFSLYLELMQRGAPIPPEVLIQASDIKDKDKILGILAEKAAAAAAQEKARTDAEISKSAIAAQGKIDAANIKAGNPQGQQSVLPEQAVAPQQTPVPQPQNPALQLQPGMNILPQR